MFKGALINNIHYCKFPKGINNIEEFVKFLNEKYNFFVELEVLIEEGCVAPFFIEEDLKTEKQYWNLSSIRFVKECEISILKRWEYKEELQKVIKKKCVNCIHYSDDVCDEDYKSFIEHIDLNGECYGYETKKQEVQD